VATAIGGIFFLRSAQTARTAGARNVSGVFGGERSYVGDVSATYRGLREFIETLPRNESLLVGGRGDVGRFKVIADRSYYRPDSALTKVALEKKVYAVLACSKSSECAELPRWLNIQTKNMDRFGKFRYETVYEARTPNARALVRRVIPESLPASAETNQVR
jgi:hypothetical protein